MNLQRKKIIFVASFFMLTVLLGFFSPTANAAKKKIGVTKFDCNFTVPIDRGHHYDIGTGAADMLTNELVKNKGYEVIERQQLAQVMQEQRLGATGAVDDSTTAQLGRLIGLNYIVYGKVLSAGAELKKEGYDFGKFSTETQVLETKVLINVRMIDATTGAIVMSSQAQGLVKKKSSGFQALIGNEDYSKSSQVQVTAEVYDQAVLQAIQQIAGRINDLNPTEGCVAQVLGSEVYLDIGIEQGVEQGQRFQVYREGLPITNASGQIIGVAKTKVAIIVVKSVEGGMSVCEIELGKKDRENGGAPIIRQGDRARLL